MSYNEYNSGRLVPMLPMDDEDNKQTLKRFIGEEFNETLFNECNGNIKEYLDESGRDYFEEHGVIYLAINLLSCNVEDSFLKIEKNKDGSYDFQSIHYNGGGSLGEVLKYGIEEYEKTKKSNS